MSEQKQIPEKITIGLQMDCIINAATAGQSSNETEAHYGGECVGESIPPWVIGRVVETYNAFSGIENPAAFMEAVAEMESALRGMSLSMSAHPDCEENSEFADYVDTANEALEMYEAAKGQQK